MDFNKLAKKAQDIYEQRGGANAAKGDITELEDIAKGEGTLMDKAKRAAQALKEPGARQAPPAAPAPPPQPPQPPTGSQT